MSMYSEVSAITPSAAQNSAVSIEYLRDVAVKASNGLSDPWGSKEAWFADVIVTGNLVRLLSKNIQVPKNAARAAACNADPSKAADVDAILGT